MAVSWKWDRLVLLGGVSGTFWKHARSALRIATRSCTAADYRDDLERDIPALTWIDSYTITLSNDYTSSERFIGASKFTDRDTYSFKNPGKSCDKHHYTKPDTDLYIHQYFNQHTDQNIYNNAHTNTRKHFYPHFYLYPLEHPHTNKNSYSNAHPLWEKTTIYFPDVTKIEQANPPFEVGVIRYISTSKNPSDLTV